MKHFITETTLVTISTVAAFILGVPGTIVYGLTDGFGASPNLDWSFRDYAGMSTVMSLLFGGMFILASRVEKSKRLIGASLLSLLGWASSCFDRYYVSA